jgi:release factor glutamine methyltransferase
VSIRFNLSGTTDPFDPCSIFRRAGQSPVDNFIKIDYFTLLKNGRILAISNPVQTWRLIDVLKEASDFLERHGIESPRVNAERLLAGVLSTDRVGLYLRFDQPLGEEERESIKAVLRRRAGREPLQYILGESEFLSLRFQVTDAVLIPRPETEMLVEDAIMRLRERQQSRVLDVGTGSGCIAVGLAHGLPGTAVDAVDVDPKALDVARRNAEQNGVSAAIRFVEADLLSEDFAIRLVPPYDAVVSNPPYVSLADWKNLPPEIRDHEPRIALSDGGDGLAMHRALAAKSRSLLVPGGWVSTEIGQGQEEAVVRFYRENGFRSVNVLFDLNGIARVVTAETR